MSAYPQPRLRLSLLAFALLMMMCFSYEARGDSTDEEDLAPGVKLRIESCGYQRTTNQISDDDDDSAGGMDDDDSAQDDDDSAGGGS